MDKGVIAVEGTPQEVFSSSNARIKEFLGKVSSGRGIKGLLLMMRCYIISA